MVGRSGSECGDQERGEYRDTVHVTQIREYTADRQPRGSGEHQYQQGTELASEPDGDDQGREEHQQSKFPTSRARTVQAVRAVPQRGRQRAAWRQL